MMRTLILEWSAFGVEVKVWGMKLSKKDSPGFTMIEVIAVLVILGIISAVAMAKVSSVIANQSGFRSRRHKGSSSLRPGAVHE